ncbi:MAG: amino acid ABC transporter permease [Cyanobacteria bacterium QS_4_48_99]|nr:MAG: amino acid ABC transporter permease [Cyanobacteria bacterium QS_4_48_99]
MTTESPIPIWRDERFWRVAAQAIAVIITIAIVSLLLVNLDRNLQRLGIEFGFEFLGLRASFDIAETPIEYNPSSSYIRALMVGLINSLRVAIAGIVLTTIVGVTVGIARLSDNWLVRNLALVYVEILRNTPLLLQLLFWYFVIFLRGQQGLTQLPGSAYLSPSGLVLPWLQATPATGIWLVLLLGGIVIAAFLWRWRIRIRLEQGVPGRQLWWALGVIALAALIAALLTRSLPFVFDLPQFVGKNRIQGGLRLSLEFAALLMGLTLYTAAFIAEIVRAGIQSVPKGQWEAARSLGLKPGLVMRLVIFPQALRVIIPPLNSEYLNLWKNSSLAIAIGYPDVYFVASTTFNQTGKAVEVMLLLAITYLGISLIISLLMNLLNKTLTTGN